LFLANDFNLDDPKQSIEALYRHRPVSVTNYRRLANFWTLFDNSGAIPRVVAFEKSEEVRIIDDNVFGALVKHYGSK
jgi:predicted ABC-type ATPase